ncbi:hypothetical protein N8339_06560 [Gammaproteobacteria bacterium]|nr:hypothetical protein [Gammaproteobacteria bacterium]
MPSNKKLLQAAAGNAGESLYVEDVFSTYLYDGTGDTSFGAGDGSAQTITNGIDLDGEGGLVWIKLRTQAESNVLFDTERGVLKRLKSDSTAAEQSLSGSLTVFNNNGFTLGVTPISNQGNEDLVSWTFRKAEKFFDVVTWTGNGTGTRTLSHNLGSVPACIIVKRSNGDPQSWEVYHESLGNTKGLHLDLTNAASTWSGYWDNTSPTETAFTVGENKNSNNPTGTAYVAYLFASDAGGFGDDGSENIIKCGSWDATGNNEVDLGFEPQWILIKNADGTNNWGLFDTMRGWTADGTIKTLKPNLSDAETSENGVMKVTSTGFTWVPAVSGNTYIYIAIRRPMKTPESGTEVFAVDNGNGSDNSPGFISGFPIDMGIRKVTTGSGSFVTSRLAGLSYLRAETTAAEVASTSATTDYMNGWASFTPQADQYSWMFKRATGFMDVVAYTGNGTAGRTVAHNLGVAPEMMIVKVRSIVEPWVVYHTGLNGGVTPQNYHIRLTNGVEAADSDIWNNTAPTSSVFTTGGNDKVNANTQTYISYLFATLAGVSKVGSYTGTGNNLNVDCGFSAGARFILIKRTDSTGDWYTYDSARGIVAGNDPYLLLNSTAAEVTNTDYIDPLSSGFTVTSSAPAALNASGGNYIFLAIA